MSLYQVRSPGNNFGPGPRYGSASISAYTVTSSSISFSHNTAGTQNRLLLVAVHIFVTGSVSTITYNGVTMTFVRADTSGVYRTEIWKLHNPVLGDYTVAVTLSAALTAIASALSMWDCHQTELDGNAGNTGTNNPATGSITPIMDDCRVVAFLTTSDTDVTFDPAALPCVIGTGALGTAAVAIEGVVYPKASTAVAWNGVGGLDTWLVSLASVKTPAPAFFVPPSVLLKDVIGVGMVPWAR
jgi:hypothetical protein